ncbi:MAG: c-type cytochrome biogenesis protein CcmI [Actinomycetota bacterium]
MSIVVVIAAAALAAVAAVGVAWPFGRRSDGLVPVDPLEDERASLLQALRDLDRDRAFGLLSDEDHRALRAETETRAVAVLRALEGRDRSGELAADLRELRPATGADHRDGGPSRRAAAVVTVAAAVVALTVPFLAGALRDRAPDQPITGGSQDALSFYRERVRAHPDDIAARLDLADHLTRAGDAEGAIAQYLAALEIDPENAEARASLGFILYLAGKPEDGLAEVSHALRNAPTYPEALYFKGVILLEGLDRPADAVDAFEAYLAAAPFGARRAEVQDLLDRARREAAES